MASRAVIIRTQTGTIIFNATVATPWSQMIAVPTPVGSSVNLLFALDGSDNLTINNEDGSVLLGSTAVANGAQKVIPFPFNVGDLVFQNNVTGAGSDISSGVSEEVSATVRRAVVPEGTKPFSLQAAYECVNEIFNALPKTRKMEHLGALNEALVAIGKATHKLGKDWTGDEGQ